MIFIHVPKTAGTSIESVLGHHGAGGVRRGVQDHRTLRQLQWPHGGAAQFASAENRWEAARAVKSRLRRDPHEANRLTVDRRQFVTYLKFAVVRNPWARAWSWYSNVRDDPQHQARLGSPPDIEFADFLERYAGSDLGRPQTHWIVDFRGRIGVEVCRFESLTSDLADLCGRAGLPELTLPHLNRTAAAGYRDVYDDRTRRIIAERYWREIDHFGYTFES